MTLPMGRPMREIFGETVAELANDDPRIYMLDGDVGTSTRADIFEKAHPDRYLQMGIAEQNMFGVAAGLATMGLIPFVSTFVSFAVVRPLDQIRVLIAQTGLNVKITPGYAGLFTGQTGMSHIIVDDMSIMRAMPGMITVSPADDVEAREVLRWAAAYEGPCYVRLVRDATQRLFGDDYRFELGKAVTVREGRDVTLISTGSQTPRVVDAAELLAADGIDAVGRLVEEHDLRAVDQRPGEPDPLLHPLRVLADLAVGAPRHPHELEEARVNTELALAPDLPKLELDEKFVKQAVNGTEGAYSQPTAAQAQAAIAAAQSAKTKPCGSGLSARAALRRTAAVPGAVVKVKVYDLNEEAVNFVVQSGAKRAESVK